MIDVTVIGSGPLDSPVRPAEPARPRRRGLQTRIVLAFTILLVTLQAAAFVIVALAGKRTSETNLAHELVIGERVFDRSVEQLVTQLQQGARILSSDFAFREAVGTQDHATIVSALDNHGARIKADLMMLMALDRTIIADTRTTAGDGQPSPLGWMVGVAQEKRTASAIVQVDGVLYQIVVVPVLAPTPIAWVAMGLRIDDRNARDLKSLTGLEVSFLGRRDDGAWTIAGSTLPIAMRRQVVDLVDHRPLDRTADPFIVSLQGDDYMTLVSSEITDGLGRVVAVLQKPVASALGPFYVLQRQLLLVSIIALLVAIVASVVIARGIAGPVHQLVAFAQRVAGGDYDTPMTHHREDEIGDLMLAFDDMRRRITDREKRILDLAYRDALTNLPNRAMFADRLQQAIAIARRYGRPVTVLVMDLDRFKVVNDSLGHQGGDQLLIEVARRLKTAVQRSSDTIARMGGDEFAILLPTEGSEDVMSVVRKVHQSLETSISIDGHDVDARASIGIATFPDHGDDLVTLLRHADSAMYLAKRNHTSHATYDPRYDEDSRQRLSLMSELRQAVADDELVLYYQPKIDLGSPGALHVEALVRWVHATRGFVPPDQFIPFAEQTGYISMITGWVLREAIGQLRRWRDGGVEMHMSINISSRDVMDAQFPATIATILAEHRCEARWVVLEITETSILGDPDQARSNIERLHAQGFRISIDDFGTGYSSLASLRRLNVDELKIDKSFVMGMAADPDDAVIIRSTIDLGHNMGLKVVAEGVETEAALQQLQAMGCDLAQGYLMSRPLPVAELERWIVESPWIRGRGPKAVQRAA